MGIDEFTRLFFEQAEGSKAKIPKAMEDAFCEPSSDAVMRDKGVRRPVQCRTSDEARAGTIQTAHTLGGRRANASKQGH
jgi:hypothetical protein